MVRKFCVDSQKVKLEVVREYQRLLEIPSCDVVTCGAPSFSSEHPTPTCLYAAERTAAHRALRPVSFSNINSHYDNCDYILYQRQRNCEYDSYVRHLKGAQTLPRAATGPGIP